jgi:Domain of unknown function (DUF6542)
MTAAGARWDTTQARPAVMLTGRGGVLMMTGIFVTGLLTASWLGWTVLVGLAFVAGCGLAARYTRPADLLTVAVTPPLAFFCVLVFAKTVTASGNALLSIAGGIALTLAATAPWLFAGVALSLVLCWRRGLAERISDLRAGKTGLAAGQGRRATPQ